jgi:aspartyl-tRNA(Asn)/glutamyl-tRNA(Gln) amidotransferase subunit A
MGTVSPAYSLRSYREALDSGSLTSRKLIDDCLHAALDPKGEGARSFVSVYEAPARAAAEAADYLPLSAGLPLRGLPISIKDLLDVEGQTTRAGSVVLKDAAPAKRDAEVITRLIDAGAVLVGRTNMTEFAFSGLGLNPHYGTPRSPYERSVGRIPGGSSSGAAVSVSDGMAVAAIGSDTGGSLRIPAALCGLTGFKPTARRVSRKGVLPLSPTLDSIGPIAPTVACCSLLSEILSGERHDWGGATIRGLRLGVLEGYALDGLEPHVAACFDSALNALSKSGAVISRLQFKSINDVPRLNAKGGFSAYEAFHWHEDLIAHKAAEYDPRVLARIARGREISDQDYAELKRERNRLIEEASGLFATVDAWVMPTTPCIAPKIADLEASDERYFDANAAMLRNPSLINFLDGCSISLPCHRRGDAPVGLMLSARGGDDTRLLAFAAQVEEALAAHGFAIQGRGKL